MSITFISPRSYVTYKVVVSIFSNITHLFNLSRRKCEKKKTIESFSWFQKSLLKNKNFYLYVTLVVHSICLQVWPKTELPKFAKTLMNFFGCFMGSCIIFCKFCKNPWRNQFEKICSEKVVMKTFLFININNLPIKVWKNDQRKTSLWLMVLLW